MLSENPTYGSRYILFLCSICCLSYFLTACLPNTNQVVNPGVSTENQKENATAIWSASIDTSYCNTCTCTCTCVRTGTGAKDFSGKKINHENFAAMASNALVGANFKGATLTACNFDGMNLKNANFSGAILQVDSSGKLVKEAME